MYIVVSTKPKQVFNSRARKLAQVARSHLQTHGRQLRQTMDQERR